MINNLIALYLPALLLFIIPIYFIFIHNFSQGNQEITFSLFFFEFSIPVQRRYLYKILITSLSCSSILFYYYTLDFTSFFPRELEMDVYFDEKGIEEVLSQYSDEELKSLKIKKDFNAREQIYFKDLDDELKKNKVVDNCFLNCPCGRENIHSSGKTTFIVQKIDGFQNYQITESKGELTHYLECVKFEEKSVKSLFEKESTNSDYIYSNIIDIITSNRIIINPFFKQTLVEKATSKGTIFHHKLSGLTQLQFFPLPKYSKTLYLFEYKSTLIPVAYANYKIKIE